MKITNKITSGITNEQQTNNKQITTTKEIKNIRNKEYKNVVEEVKEEIDSCVDGFQEVIDFYNNNINLISPYSSQVLDDFTRELGSELVIYAMQKAVEANARNIKYIKGILNNWSKKGIKTLIQAKEEEQKFKNNKNNAEKTKNYNNYEQRQYLDFNKFYSN